MLVENALASSNSGNSCLPASSSGDKSGVNNFSRGLHSPRYSRYLRYWYKSTNSDTSNIQSVCGEIRLLALLVQKYKF
jgi:hypothetical protein